MTKRIKLALHGCSFLAIATCIGFLNHYHEAVYYVDTPPPRSVVPVFHGAPNEFRIVRAGLAPLLVSLKLPSPIVYRVENGLYNYQAVCTQDCIYRVGDVVEAKVEEDHILGGYALAILDPNGRELNSFLISERRTTSDE